VRFHAQTIARGGIQHPRRHGKKHAIAQLDDEAVFGASPKAPHDVTVMIEKWMMPVANPNW
jgi:hypothetical protein